MRFLGLLSAIVFTALLGSLFVGSPAKAQSPYDDAILLTDSIGVTTDAGYYDISNSWLTVFDQYKDRTQGGVYIGDLYDEFLDVLYSENPQYGLHGSYSTPESISTGYARNTQLFWIRPGCSYTGDTFTETSYSIHSSASNCIQRISFSADPNNTDDIRLEQYRETNWTISLNTPTNQRKIFFSTLEPNYPPNYEGETIPDRWTSTDRTFGLSPFFNYQVDDMTITLTQLTDPTLLDEYSIDECTFLVQSGIGVLGYYDYPFNCQSPLPTFHTFTEYGQYEVKLNYYSSENDKTYETTQVLIIDGTTYTGRAGGQSQGNSIISMLQDFTLPNHGLQQALVAPIQFVGSLPSLVDTCQPINLPLPAYVGSNDNIELPCLTPVYNSYAPQFLILWQVALTALVSYATVNKVFAKLRETYNPRRNSIEPTNL